MVVVAHPGDEAFGFGGAIAQAAASGAYTVVVCATRGAFDRRLLDPAPAPGGRNRSYQKPTVWRNLDTVREDELRRSVGLLGVRVLRMLDYAEEGLSKVSFDELVGRIVQPIRMHRPEVILSFGPEGVSGDPDHVVVGRATAAAFERAGEPLAYEDDLEEDQVAWRAAKLYQLVVPATVGERARRARAGELRLAGRHRHADPGARRAGGGQAGRHPPPRLADRVGGAVPRLAARGARRVPRHRALPAGSLQPRRCRPAAVSRPPNPACGTGSPRRPGLVST